MAKRVFLEHDAAEKSPDGAAGAARPRPEVGKLLATLSPFIALFPALLLLLASIKALNPLVGEARSAKALLLGYRNWYITMICAVVVGVLLVAIGIFIAVKKGMRTRQALRVMAVSLALFLVVGGLMLVKEEVPALLSQAQADLRQIEEDRLETVTVWLHPKSRAAGLPGPYTQGQPEPTLRYGGIGEDTDGTWVYFYVPNALDFSLDQDALYREGKSIAWNQENARQYRVSYTEHFHLVVSIAPLE